MANMVTSDNCLTKDVSLASGNMSAETRLHRSESDSQLRSEGWPQTLTPARPESERCGERRADWSRPGGIYFLRDEPQFGAFIMSPPLG